MDGANFISKVVNDLVANAAQNPTDANAQAQEALPEMLQDGSAEFISGLTLDEVEQLYHEAVREREMRAAFEEDGLDRSMTQGNLSIGAAARIELAAAEVAMPQSLDLAKIVSLSTVSFPAVAATGALSEDGHSPLLFTPNDTLYGNQWHLNQTGAGLFDLGDLQTIWDEYTGNGVRVAVMDDGFDRNHEDLVGNYSNVSDWDILDNDTDASPGVGNSHGTAVAGIIGAVGNNNLGTTGIAFDSTIFGFRVNGTSINNSLVEDMTKAANYASGVDTPVAGGSFEADIMNMSYGTMWSGNYFDETLDNVLMDALNTAFNNGVVSGRGGLGTIYVKSAGNSRNTDPGDFGNVGHDANASSWNANIHTISVAAVDQDGGVSSYSTHGANILISGFGTPGQVWTTDRTGTDGYSSGNYTGSFNGTSAAAPMVSGVIALMLEANSSLGWRDVQEILAYSARHVGSAVGAAPTGDEEYTWEFNGANDWNGGGLHFSNDYGFGLIDAFAAVRMAEVWTGINGGAKTSANDTVTIEDILNTTTTLTGSNVANNFTFTESTDIRIEHVTVDINFIEWDDLGDLDIVLIAPDGTEIHLIDNTGENDGTAAGGYAGDRWTFTSPGLMGMSTGGTWTLVMRDQDSNTISPITINDIDIRFHGSAADDDAHFVFTNEFSDYSGLASHSTNFGGGGTGVDVINAVAVTSNSTVDLQTNSGTIDGVAITNSNIQKVYTGDGNDTIIGDAFSTHLYGGRGNDTISIGGGSQTQSLYGGDGNDTLTGGGGNDTIYGGDGADRIFNSSGIDRMYAGDGDDIFWFVDGDVADAGSYIYGGTGSDRILLSLAGTVDLSNDIEISSIEEIQFNGDGGGVSKTLILGSDELQTGELADVLIDGNGASTSDDNIIINMGTETVMDLSGWTFQDWTDIDTITINGDSDAETLTGSTEADTIDGNAGVDTIYGGAGNDRLIGGLGQSDELYGGADDDTLVFESSTGFDHFYGGSGTDTLEFDWSSNTTFQIDAGVYGDTGSATTWAVNGIENFQMTGTGNEIFEAAYLGETTINGGAGIDTIDMSSNGVNIASTGIYFLDIDQGYSSNGGATYTNVWSNIENLITFGMVATTMIGNSSANTLTGSIHNDEFFSEGGNDTVYGGAGDDIINAGSGINEFYGGAGNDTIYSSGYGSYFGGADNDTIHAGNGGAETLDGGAGIDTLNTTLWNGTYEINLNTGVTNYGGESFVNFENLILGNGNNTVVGTNGANTIMGGTGSDTVTDGDGADMIDLGDGDDRLLQSDYGSSADVYDGGAGVDTFDTQGAAWGVDVTIDLTAGIWSYTGGSKSVLNFENIEGGNNTGVTIETLIGSIAANTINGNNGIDHIYGGSGLDDLYGGAGDDELFGGNGADDMFGGTGKDKMYGGIGDDAMHGGDEADKLFGDNGSDALYGGSGGDTLNGNDGDDTIWGGEGADIIKGGNGNDTIEGDNGFDDINGGAGDDFLGGGGGNDSIVGGDGIDTVYGDSGNDEINAGFGDDIIYGGTQGDVIEGGNGFDTIDGGNGNDVLNGNSGNDVIYGGVGLDDINGAVGLDDLYGGNGHDTINGGDGHDTLTGGNGDDTLTGGNGNDTFVFAASSDDDVITDFTVGVDTIQIIGLTAANVSFSNAGGGDTLIMLSTGDTILVENTTIAQLNTFSDFDFV